MLYGSLIVAVLVLFTVNFAASLPSKRVVLTAVLAFGMSVASAFWCMTILPPVVLQCTLLIAVGLIWKVWGQQRPARYFLLSSAATLAAFVGMGLTTLSSQQEYSRLREQYPLVSLEDRIPRRKGISPSQPPVAAKLDDLESKLEDRIWRRTDELRRLHEQKVKLFVDSPGFGVTRMRGGPSEAALAGGLHEKPAPLQPADENPSSLIPPDGSPEPPTVSMLEQLHSLGVRDFVHPRGFGYVKNVQQVAGFQGHGFEQVPSEKSPWEIARLELVSLLKHAQPVVYVSPRLPRMEDLASVPVRDLDAFEKEGLASLIRGEDLVVRDARMMGSIRSTRQCLQCHGGNRGDLLGAFTYTLRPATKK